MAARNNRLDVSQARESFTPVDFCAGICISQLFSESRSRIGCGSSVFLFFYLVPVSAKLAACRLC
jgi:hypothetical protein